MMKIVPLQSYCQDPECQVLAEYQPGNGATGDPCTVASDCSSANNNDPICLDEVQAEFPGGSCSEFCNTTLQDCAAGAICVESQFPSDDSGACLDTCQNDSDCRAGYICIDDFGLNELVCFLENL